MGTRGVRCGTPAFDARCPAALARAITPARLLLRRRADRLAQYGDALQVVRLFAREAPRLILGSWDIAYLI